jgi:hypothetical protein
MQKRLNRMMLLPKLTTWMRRFLLIVSLLVLAVFHAGAADQPKSPAAPDCRVEPVDYKGWQAQQISNRWVQLIVVPQNGGRLMQVNFAGHAYLFVNPKYAGKYLPPDPSQWFNYGGDKLWLLPEGNDNEKQWAGGSDILDDGPFSFRKLSEGRECEIELTGPSDPQTGVQFVRTIHLDAGSPRIRFRATMKNVTGHMLEWSMQSVSQYNTGVSSDPARMNHDFWTYTPVNPASSYLNRYHVRFGPAENSAVSVGDDGLFKVHYVHMAAELWLDSTADWLAVVDGSSRFAMVERFHYQQGQPYPGKASVIFWTNGPEVRLDRDGTARMSGGEEGNPPFYLEAELNSPMCRLRPSESCEMETEWFPTRGGAEFRGVTDVGIVMQPLRATRLENGKIHISGSFGVFFEGKLSVRFYNEHGRSSPSMAVAQVSPTEPVILDTEIDPPGKPARLSLHLEDSNGVDRGAFDEVEIEPAEHH